MQLANRGIVFVMVICAFGALLVAQSSSQDAGKATQAPEAGRYQMIVGKDASSYIIFDSGTGRYWVNGPIGPQPDAAWRAYSSPIEKAAK